MARSRLAIGAPLLRLRSDEQLVSLFRAGNDEAFRVIHDRYRARMFAYTRQMLGGSPQDPEDAVQEIFVRAYAGLRANGRELALRPWLYRIAHNRCIDELRRPHAVALETIDSVVAAVNDPVIKAEQRDSLRRLIVDVQRLPGQQRSALLMREMGGMAYADAAGALGVSVPAVKSLLVRARLGLAQANEARDTACAEIREDLIASHDRGVRASGLARRHMRDCAGCREFRSEVRGVSRRFAALTPTLGPLGVLANLLGWGGGGGAAAGSGAMAGGGTAAAGTGAAASAGVLAGSTGHVVTLLAAAVVATGGAVEIQHTLGTPNAHRAHAHQIAARPQSVSPSTSSTRSSTPSTGSSSTHAATKAPVSSAAAAPGPAPARVAPARSRAQSGAASTSASENNGQPSSHGKPDPTKTAPLSETLNPDNMMYGPSATDGSTSSTGSTNPGSTSATGTTGSSTGTAATGSTSPTGTSGAPGTTTGTIGATGTSGDTTPTGSGTTSTSGEPDSGTSGSGGPTGGSGAGSGGFGTTGGGSGTASTSTGSITSSAGAGGLASAK